MENKSPSSKDIIFTILSAHPKGTRFLDLRQNLYNTLVAEKENPLISQHFRFYGNPLGMYSPEVDQEVTNMRAFHSLSSDTRGYIVDFSEEEGICKKALERFSAEDIDYLQGLGKRLKEFIPEP